MALILNPQTGLVSPQFHVRFDPEFTTVPDYIERYLWQSLAGFVRGTQTCRLDRQKRRNQTEELSLQQLPPSDLAPNPHHQEGETNSSSADVPSTQAPITNQDSDLPINIPTPYQGLQPPEHTSPFFRQDGDADEVTIPEAEDEIDKGTQRNMSGQEGGNKRKRSTRLKWTDSNSNSNIPILKSKRETKPIDRM